MTNPFTLSEPQNPSHDVPDAHKTRRSPDVGALKLGKERSGSYLSWEAEKGATL